MENQAQDAGTMLGGRVAIVTGAGLGQSHAVLLARRGAKILVNDINAAAADTVGREIVPRYGFMQMEQDLAGGPAVQRARAANG